MTRAYVPQDKLDHMADMTEMCIGCGDHPIPYEEVELLPHALRELSDLRWAVTILRALWLEGRPPKLSTDLSAYESVLKWWDEYKPTIEDRMRANGYEPKRKPPAFR